MIEGTIQTPPGAENDRGLDYDAKLAYAGRKLRPLDLRGQEKLQILTAISAALFPENTDKFKRTAEMDDDQFRETLESVYCSKKLFAIFREVITGLAPNPRQRFGILQGKVEYDNKWERSREIPKPEAERRLLVILEEHLQRYRAIPVDFETLGQAIGKLTKQRAHQIWTGLKKKEQIPEGIFILPQGQPKQQ